MSLSKSIQTFIKTDTIAIPILIDKKNEFIIKRTELYNSNPKYENQLRTTPKCMRALINIFIFYPEEVLKLIDRMEAEHGS